MLDVLNASEIVERLALASAIPYQQVMARLQRSIIDEFAKGNLKLWSPHTLSMRSDNGPTDPCDVTHCLRGSSGYLLDIHDDTIVSPSEEDASVLMLTGIDSRDSEQRDPLAPQVLFTEKTWSFLRLFQTPRAWFARFYSECAIWPKPLLEAWWPDGATRVSSAPAETFPTDRLAEQARRKSGPKKGSGLFVASDRALFPQIIAALKEEKTLRRAIIELVDSGRAAGHGVPASKYKRLYNRFKKEHPEVYSRLE